jgi:alkylated DNA repair dioxygenase AlkB
MPASTTATGRMDMQPSIDGLRYIPDYVDQAWHDDLLSCVDMHAWLDTVDHRFQVYGYRYHHPTRSVFPAEALPSWAGTLADRLCRDGLMPDVPNQLVVNDYAPGAGFFAHVDQAAFGDRVASVSLGSSCVMRFLECDDRRTEEILLEPRSILLLSGEARWNWRHGIPARSTDVWQQRERPRARRVSLTFRIVPTTTDAARP